MQRSSGNSRIGESKAIDVKLTFMDYKERDNIMKNIIHIYGASGSSTSRIERLKKRERENFGSRIDFGGDMYEIHQKFIEWALSGQKCK